MNSSSPQLWSVAVEAPLPQSLTYIAPENLSSALCRGQLIQVPLGKRKAQGVLLGPGTKTEQEEKFKIKEIISINEEYPPLPEIHLRWMEWVSKYYMYPPGLVCTLAYPPLKKQTKARASKKAPIIKIVEKQTPPEMTEEQKKVFHDISLATNFSAHLLFGVTGSGKTEVYLRLLEENLKNNKTGLVLVPEISLTPQLLHRFSARFGDQIAVLHSQLTDRERTQQWWDIVEKRKRILIGARSALFCPIEDLGLIIVDEEHESSYKQDEKLKYNGRDAAVALARFHNCKVVLGSATPSLESWRNAKEKKYHLHEMKLRVESRSLPEIKIIDMKDEKDNPERRAKYANDLPSWLSLNLYEQLQTTLEKGDQAALFLNRRGVANMLLCGECGHIIECPNCDISLTQHGRHHLVCHYCDYHQSLPEVCPDCHEGEMAPVGLGTETVENDLQRLFPEAKLARADRDEIQTREELESLIEEMESGEVDLLIGTQMIAKGLDFPKLNLVGIVLADIGFNLPDFRATERSFQLITQVAGRAGRHVKKNESPGQVVLQTYNPEHPALQFALSNDYVGFAESELENRKDLNYPPVGRLISLRLQSTQLIKVQDASQSLARRAQQLQKSTERYQSIEFLGPAEAPIAKLRGQYRFHTLIKGSEPGLISAYVKQLLSDESWVPSSVRIIVDVDPLHLL